MKFHNGCWLFKEGYECFTPQHVYEKKIKEDEIILCAPTGRINHKGDTLGGINRYNSYHSAYAGNYPCTDLAS